MPTSVSMRASICSAMLPVHLDSALFERFQGPPDDPGDFEPARVGEGQEQAVDVGCGDHFSIALVDELRASRMRICLFAPARPRAWCQPRFSACRWLGRARRSVSTWSRRPSITSTLCSTRSSRVLTAARSSPFRPCLFEDVARHE